MENYTEYCKNFIIDNLENLEGEEVYLEELFYFLTREMEANGTATFSTQLAIDYLTEWWYEVGEFIEDWKANCGVVDVNPFLKPERFHVIMIREGISNLLYNSELISENEYDKVELTKEMIEQILEDIEDCEIEF